jgi:hypothetical protein
MLAEGMGAYACVVVSNMTFGAASLARTDAIGAKGPLERGSELCRVTNMAPMRTLTQALLGSTHAALGDLAGGVARWDDALAGAGAMHDRYGEAQVLWNRGRTFARQPTPDWPAALADLSRAVELFEQMETLPSLARALHERGKVLRAMGESHQATLDDERSLLLGRKLGLRDEPFT